MLHYKTRYIYLLFILGIRVCKYCRHNKDTVQSTIGGKGCFIFILLKLQYGIYYVLFWDPPNLYKKSYFQNKQKIYLIVKLDEQDEKRKVSWEVPKILLWFPELEQTTIPLQTT